MDGERDPQAPEPESGTAAAPAQSAEPAADAPRPEGEPTAEGGISDEELDIASGGMF